MFSTNSTPDGYRKVRAIELIEKLKCENPDRFQSMTKMHLGVFMDAGNVLNAEELDEVVSTSIPYSQLVNKERKKSTKKLSLAASRKRKSTEIMIEANCSHLFGVPLTQEGIAAVEQLIQFLEKDEINSKEGLFRVNGSSSRQNELRTKLSEGETLDLSVNGDYTAHDVASVLKSYLTELPSPVITNEHYPVYTKICDFDRTDGLSEDLRKKANLKRINAIRLLMVLLPPENIQLFKLVMDLLYKTSQHSELNKMDDKNLARVFLPVLMLPKTDIELEDMESMTDLLAFMIRHETKLFTPPPPLLRDVEKYYGEGAVYQDLLERSADTSATGSCISAYNSPMSFKHRRSGQFVSLEARTTVAFVDTKESMEDTEKINTATAMADLYAHVQSMPDGAAKTRLLKKFQKHNRAVLGVANPKSKFGQFTSKIKKRVMSRSRRRSRSFSTIGESGEKSTDTNQRSNSVEDLLDTDDSMSTTGTVSTTCLMGSTSYLMQDIDSSLTKQRPKFSDACVGPEVSSLPDANLDLSLIAKPEKPAVMKLPCLDEFKQKLRERNIGLEREDTTLTLACETANDEIKAVVSTPKSRKPIVFGMEHL